MADEIPVSKSSLDSMLQSILSVSATEQSMNYSPKIYSDQYNTVTSLLISALAKSYPLSNEKIDVLQPFMVFTRRLVTGGYVQLPDDYRNILGNPSISAKPDGSGECGTPSVKINSLQQFNTEVLKSGCKSRPITIVGQGEWDYLTTSSYKFPTYTDPIGKYVGNKIQVCPYDLSSVYLLYVKKEKTYRYGYILQPDDTFIFDKDSTIESEFTSAAFDMIFPAMMTLYSAYMRDNTISDWVKTIKQQGIL